MLRGHVAYARRTLAGVMEQKGIRVGLGRKRRVGKLPYVCISYPGMLACMPVSLHAGSRASA